METLNKKFEAETGYASWINSDIYPDGKIYTQEYVKWLESKAEIRKLDDDPLRSFESFVYQYLNSQSFPKYTFEYDYTGGSKKYIQLEIIQQWLKRYY